MKIKAKIFLVMATIAMAIFLCVNIFGLPEVKPIDADVKEFSAAGAMKHVEIIAKAPHRTGTSENGVVRQYIMDELTKLGLEPEVQKASFRTEINGQMISGYIYNVHAVLKGNGSSKEKILVAAHYDSTPMGPGAGDDASGVATLLESVRALKEGPSLQNDILFLFTEGEEMGLLGAKAFVEQNPLFKDIKLALNFDAKGNTGPIIMFETGNQNGWLMKGYKKVVSNPVAYSFLSDGYKYMPNTTDFTEFKKAGLGGFNFSPIQGSHVYHNMEDTPENLNKQTLQQEGESCLSF
ncbi:MAG: M20/M25/M40 family metallo-hydrolase [Clostridiales bacterium]|nr:M20/M25/M40 family metallo-hydrolase [Clostridiales bacterium]